MNLATVFFPCSNRHGCTPEQIRRYRTRLSAPLLDRIYIHIDVPRVPKEQLRRQSTNGAESSQDVRNRVVEARQ